jgi:hypothetical protein
VSYRARPATPVTGLRAHRRHGTDRQGANDLGAAGLLGILYHGKQLKFPHDLDGFSVIESGGLKFENGLT